MPNGRGQALTEFLREREYKAFHADKILQHLAKEVVLRGSTGETGKTADDELFDRIEGLPKGLPSELRENFTVLSSKVASRSDSADGDTTKLIVELQDGFQVESVIMRYDPKKGRAASKPGHKRTGKARATLCISSQVGCQMACKFCATGTMGLKGNLNAAEIFEQLIHSMRIQRIRNIVFMGMGEPLNNYKAVQQAIRMMVDTKLYGLSPSHITVSTVGVTNRIKSLAHDLPGINLALSLHAPNQELRLSIVPTSKAYPVHKLIQACQSWQEATGKKVFFEYVVLGGINDQRDHALELGDLLKDLKGVVNLIPWNPTVSGALEGYKAPNDENLLVFQKLLREKFGMYCTIRREFGQDINSACGQLVINSESSCAKTDDW